MGGCKVAVISASLGGMDKPAKHEEQTLKHDYFYFTDENFPPREKAMTSRLQAKIPKMFGWQLKPGYDYYFWIDGSLRLSSPDSLEHFFYPDYDLVALRHPRRPNIRQEHRYYRKGMRQQSQYMIDRYNGEWTVQQYDIYRKDENYTDDLMINGGFFMYRNTPEVREMLKEWWYHTTRYSVFDQLSFPYVLKKSGIDYKVLDDDYHISPYLEVKRHAR